LATKPLRGRTAPDVRRCTALRTETHRGAVREVQGGEVHALKQDLFRAAVTHALDGDVEAAGRCLSDTDRPLRDRLIEAFDHWTGRYVGPMTKTSPS
jgi:hypothetical protein